MSGPTLRLGSRGSRLALIQSELIAAALREIGAQVELVTIVTAGDTRPPDTAWGEGAFVGALEAALLDGRVDLAVHSAKDVPIEAEDSLVIAAYPTRIDPRDVVVLPEGARLASLEDLARGALVGTDSPRRTGFLRAARPDLRVVPLHGNVDTRLARLDRGEVDALVLAYAGLARLGRLNRVSLPLPPDVVPPAPGQGALAVQVRADDALTSELVARLDDPSTRLAVSTERTLLEAMGGGCRAPVGALADVRGDTVELLAAAVEADGSGRRLTRRSVQLSSALEAARGAAAELTAAGPGSVQPEAVL